MAAYTYILRCADGTFYAGSTIDLDTRLETHAQGLGSDYTSCRRPLELVWFAEFERIDEAFGLEKRIQGWSHAKRQAFIEGGFDAIKGWSARERALHSPGR
ncbi:GIY-YIG nuclease family protein [Microbacterium arabinogalactanolyticum]|uniref:GIY-YIG nuclease family protein n=1 Tax=Microbacterium arabinogalactanolyticum TaxID=69365 RepID=UPI004043EAC5